MFSNEGRTTNSEPWEGSEPPATDSAGQSPASSTRQLGLKGNRGRKSKRPVPDVWRPAAVFDGYGR